MHEINTAIAEFSKANKVSKTKLLAFTKAIIAMQEPVNVGKPVSEESQKVRETIRSMQGRTFTSKMVAEKCKVSNVVVNNNLRYLMKKEKIASVVGKEKAATRGKPSLLWTVNKSLHSL